MENSKPLINKVAQSALVTLDLEAYFPKAEEIVLIDMKDFLFKGLILREKEFRESVKQKNWSEYKGKYVVISCSTDAIIPMWAYMVLSAQLSPYAIDIANSDPSHAAEIFLYRNLARLDFEQFRDQRIVIKGCGEKQVPEAAYVQITQALVPIAQSVMYGEPCSTVPVFKRKAGTIEDQD